MNKGSWKITHVEYTFEVVCGITGVTHQFKGVAERETLIDPGGVLKNHSWDGWDATGWVSPEGQAQVVLARYKLPVSGIRWFDLQHVGGNSFGRFSIERKPNDGLSMPAQLTLLKDWFKDLKIVEERPYGDLWQFSGVNDIYTLLP